MIKMLTASTCEVDDGEQAVCEILNQLELEKYPHQNSVGILLCTLEFMQSGVAEAVCRSLPCKVVGCNTTVSSVHMAYGAPVLCVSVIISDELEFSVALSDSLLDNKQERYRQMYEEARGQLTGDPVLALAFLPILPNTDDRVMMNLLFEAAGQTPVFGTLAMDFDDSPRLPMTFFDGRNYTDRACLILIAGPLKPRFVLLTIPPESIKKQKSIITKSEGNILMEVNEIPALQFMRSLGIFFTPESGVAGLNVNPLMLDLDDGSVPSARPIHAVTEEGYLLCAGQMPKGAKLAMGIMEAESVTRTCEHVCHEILKVEDAHAALLFSCVSRQFLLAWEEMAEVELTDNLLGGKIPYMFCYSGGEVCPVVHENGKMTNNLFNNTLIACVF